MRKEVPLTPMDFSEKLQITDRFACPARLYECRDTTSGLTGMFRGYWISYGRGLSRAAFFFSGVL